MLLVSGLEKGGAFPISLASAMPSLLIADERRKHLNGLVLALVHFELSVFTKVHPIAQILQQIDYFRASFLAQSPSTTPYLLVLHD